MTRPHDSEPRKPSPPLGLIAANAALALAGAALLLAPIADAQNAPGRPRGQYAILGGEIQTGDANALYVIDSLNREMVVLRWLDSQKKLDGIGYRDLAADIDARPTR